MLGREINVNDHWNYHGVTYTVQRNENTNELYFKHPSDSAHEDDHIHIEHAHLGDFIYKEA